MSSPKNILSTLKPCYYANFLVGNAPFRFLQSKCQIRIIHLTNYYIAFNIIDLVLVVYLLYSQYVLISQENLSTVMTTAIITTHSAFSVVHFLQNAILNRAQRFTIVKLCEKLFAIDKQLNNLQIRIDYNALMWKSIRFAAAGFTGMTIYYVFLDRMYNRRITGNYIIYSAVIRHVFMSCLFLTCLQIITEFLDKLNENLAHQETSRSLVTKSSRIFTELSEAVKLTNRMYDYQILFSFAMTFVLITLKLYNIIRIVSLEGKIESNAALSLLIMLSEKLIIAYTSHRCMDKVSKTKETFGKLWPPGHNSKLSKEINAFGLLLLHNRFKITARDFFTLDLQIFLSICSNVITYVTILLQAELTVEHQTEIRKYVN